MRAHQTVLKRTHIQLAELALFFERNQFGFRVFSTYFDAQVDKLKDIKTKPVLTIYRYIHTVFVPRLDCLPVAFK